MADECLLAIPEIEGIDYTTKELLNFVEQLKAAANRLNREGKILNITVFLACALIYNIHPKLEHIFFIKKREKIQKIS